MATAEEIRARVRRVDEQRIARRADAAATVGELADEQERLQRDLAELDKRLGAATGQALAVMTADELATFTGRPRREVEQWLGNTGSRGARRASRPDPAGRGQRGRTTPGRAAPAETPGTAATDPTSDGLTSGENAVSGAVPAARDETAA